MIGTQPSSVYYCYHFKNFCLDVGCTIRCLVMIPPQLLQILTQSLLSGLIKCCECTIGGPKILSIKLYDF